MCPSFSKIYCSTFWYRIVLLHLKCKDKLLKRCTSIRQNPYTVRQLWDNPELGQNTGFTSKVNCVPYSNLVIKTRGRRHSCFKLNRSALKIYIEIASSKIHYTCITHTCIIHIQQNVTLVSWSSIIYVHWNYFQNDNSGLVNEKV